MANTTRATFVSQKINKIRWRQQQKQTLNEPDVFVTGSWDDFVRFFSFITLC